MNVITDTKLKTAKTATNVEDNGCASKDSIEWIVPGLP